MGYNGKGTRRERELANYIDKTQFVRMRAPASGAGTTTELPDILAGDGENFYAIEAKSSGGDPIYIKEKEVEGLKLFSNAFGAEDKIGVIFDAEYHDPYHGNDELTGWYFFDPEDLHVTPAGNYRVKKEKAINHGTPFRDLFGEIKPE